MQYRKEIDGLRALAVTAVIANHVDKDLLPSGFLGVDIFFVISGYVITASFQGRPRESLGNFLSAFYARRIKRLLPALAVCVVVTALLISLFNPQPRVHLLTGVAALFGVSNFYLIKQASSYFGDAAQLNPFTHTWSLGVEEQFYLLFPLLVWSTLLGDGRSASSSRRFHAVLAILSLASIGLFAWLGATKPHVAYYFMPARFWELACGALAFGLAHRAGFNVNRRSLQWIAPAVLAMTMLLLFAPARLMLGTTVACVALTVGLIVWSRQGTWSYAVLGSRPVVYVGLISYSLYLWHWGVLTIARWTVGINEWTIAPLLLVMLGLAAGSYRWIERPLRQASWSLRSMTTVGIGFASATACASTVFALASPLLLGNLYLGKQPDTAAPGIGTLLARHMPSQTEGGWRGKPCVLESNQDVGKVVAPADCTLGNFDTATTRILVVGNSYAAAFVQAFDTLVQRDGYAVTLVSSWGASAIRGLPNHTPWNLSNQYYWDELVPKLTSGLKAGDWVFLVSDIAIYSSISRDSGSDAILDTLAGGVASFAEGLHAKGIRVAVMHANPFIRDASCEPAAATRQWFTVGPGPCKFMSRRETLGRRASLDQRLRGLEQRGLIVLVDLMDLFCPTDTCHFHGAAGTLMYRDIFSHPSVEAARLSAPIIRSRLVNG